MLRIFLINQLQLPAMFNYLTWWGVGWGVYTREGEGVELFEEQC